MLCVRGGFRRLYVLSFGITLASLICSSAVGQTAPVVMPYTISTVAGPGAATTAATACFAGSSLNATDAFADGCPATQAIFSSDFRGGVTTDPLGNVYVADTTNNLVRKIDPRSGLITVFAGGGKSCTAAQGAISKSGDGCLATTQTVMNSPRGIGNDPYGNIFIAGYSDNLVHIVCTAVSPLCTAAQVGFMRIAAGCTATATASGTSGNAGDGLTAAGLSTTCGTTVAEVNQPRGVNADSFGNIYVGDTGNSRFRVVVGPVIAGVTNPLIAILQMNPTYSSITAASAAGKVYPIAGGAQFTVPATGAVCSASNSSVALDGNGDGCPFYNTSVSAVGGFVQGVAVDSFGDFIFTDSVGVGRVRVLFAGGANNPMAHVITVNNSTITSPVVGYVYSIAGGGSTTTPVTPILASSSSLDGNLFRVNTDAAGNIYLGDNSQILFLDINTGYLRKMAANNTVCAGANAFGDGCPATQSSFGGSTGVLGLALDNLGNLYFADGTNHTIRKISSTNFAPVAAGSSASPSIFIHAAAGTSSITTTLAANSDFTLGAASCVTNAAPDSTYDCTIPVTVTPTAAGVRDAPISIQPSSGPTVTASLTATGTGANLSFDPASPAVPTTQTLGTVVPSGVVVDGHGNAYTVDSASKVVTQVTAAASAALGSALSALPNQIAADPTGNVYAATVGSASITKLSLTAPSTYTASTISNAAIVSAAAIAVDANGNVYVADNTTGAVVKFSQTTGLATTLTVTAFTNPVALALDNVGNVLVADKGAGKVYRLPTGGVRTGLPPVVAVTGTIVPVGVAADAAGDVFIADSGSKSVVMVPASGAQTTVATGFTTLNGIAIDGAGNLYASDAATPGILKVLRNQYSFPFGTSLTATLSGTVTNAGNAAATGFAQTDAADFQVTGTGATCNTGATSVQPGAACTVAATFTPAAAGSGAISDVVSFLPPTSFGALNLTAVKAGNLTTTTTTIGGETPAAPVYVAGGASVMFSITVAASTGTAIGNVTVSLDGGTGAVYPLNSSGVATVVLTGLTAGSHSLAATYPTQGGVSGSNSGAFSFSVAKAMTTVSWTPTTLTEQYSQGIGVGVFNATSGGVAGAFVYSVTPSGGAAMAVDSSSYLPIGSYSLAVVFTPTDQVDYAPSSGSVANFTVTKANTTAPVGASTNVVAADGSGNFTTITSAVAALPATGGAIYIRPGTYKEQFTVSYPNVALRGLGGVAQNVILTAEAGAFSAPLPTGVAPGNNGGQGDQGSSTVVVDKSTINGTSYTPLNFYAENLSIQNTYDTDATNSNTLAVVSGSCTAGQPATNNFALYNAGTLCASQALALWTRGDKSVFNNVRLISLQDTLFAGSVGCGTTCTAARQYFYNGYITGDVDYIFGDAAMVFDHTTFFTTFHGLTATGTETIEAQNKARQTGSAGDYLSGYILNSANLTSQAPGMTQLYYGRPYGQYSTFIMLNTTVDQVNPLGWIEFSGDSNLPSSTYAEFNTQGAGGTATSIAGREAISLQPEQLTAAQAAQYAPITFLSTPAPDVWNPADALTAGVNGFVPSGTAVATTVGKSITILARPQTPGGGAIPTGNYTLMDGSTVLASGTLDPSGSAYLTTSALTAGVHKITLSYGGDANFNASTTSTPLTVTVGGTQTAVNVTTSSPVYGTPINVTVTVTQNAPTAAITGSVVLSVDGGALPSQNLTGGVATFILNNIGAGAHTLTAVYSGDTNNGTSTGTASVTVSKAGLTVTGPTVSVVFGSAIPTYAATYAGFVGSETAATALTGAPSLSTTPTTPTAVGTYPIVAAVGTLVAPNYSLTFVNGALTIVKAPTTTTLASSNASPGQNTPVTFTATVVSPSKAAPPTGFVGFYNGTTLLSNITLPASGVATYTAGLSTLGAASITAVYSGDSSFTGSTSTAATETTVVSGFGVSASPSSLTIQRGSTGTTTITFTPTGNYVGTASLACSGLPTYATCTFSPLSVTFTGNNAPATSTLTIGTGSAHSSLTAPPLQRAGRTSLAGFFLLPGTLLAGIICVRRRKLGRSAWGLFTVLLLNAAMLAAAGCGSSPQETLAGTDTITITANSINGVSTTSQQFTLNVTVTQ